MHMHTRVAYLLESGEHSLALCRAALLPEVAVIQPHHSRSFAPVLALANYGLRGAREQLTYGHMRATGSTRK